MTAKHAKETATIRASERLQMNFSQFHKVMHEAVLDGCTGCTVQPLGPVDWDEITGLLQFLGYEVDVRHSSDDAPVALRIQWGEA